MHLANSFNKVDPSRRPEWRLNRVLEMVDRIDGCPGRCTPRDDDYVKALRRFILRYRASDDERARHTLLAENPGLFWAFQLFERKDDNLDQKAILVEARLLAGQSDENISQELCTIPEVAEWYEAIFFNVRDRLGNLDWIMDQVLYPAINRSLETSRAREAGKPKGQRSMAPTFAQPFDESLLKYFGYFGGQHVLESAISGFRRGRPAQSPEDVARYFSDHFSHQIHYRAAAAATTFGVNERNVMELLNVHCRLLAIAKSSDSLEDKQDATHRAVAGLLKEIPFATGDAGAKLVAGTPIEQYDNMAAEIRDSELLSIASGGRPGSVKAIERLALPPPHSKNETHAGGEAELR